MPPPIPLAWPEIRKRALAFAHEYRDAVQEDEDAQSFWNEFFDVFGKRRRGTARFEYKVRKRAAALPAGEGAAPEAPDLGRGRIDLFWPGVLLAESKSRHKNLDDAYAQALEYIGNLPAYERPQYIFTSDFARLRLYDLRGKTVYPTAADHVEIPVAELGKHVRLFGFMAGYEQRTYQEQDPVNRTAAERMGKLHDQLEASGYRGADLERYLVRLLFCLFAEDTDIFPRASFMDLVRRHAGPKGQQLGPLLHQFFEVLDTPENQRSAHLPEHLREFPYVNGDLFKGGLRIADFSEAMRELLLEATTLDWGQVSPAIFGSLFQSVMEDGERRANGAHYTSEANILKAIGPLFLDELRARLTRLEARVPSPERTRDLGELHNELARLRLLDPACGCGNFLVVAYRELRQLELDLLALRYPGTGGTQFPLGVETAVQLSVEQMHGIELDEFAARIAEVALWLVDHQLNQRLSERFGHYMARIPLRQRAHIRHGNALTTDWNEVLPREQATHIVGNPPFVGKQYQTPTQKANMALVFQGVRGASALDFVAAWFWKAAEYIQGTKAEVALVSTNSITQGEQVSLLWGPLIGRFGLRINFAHQTFKWRNEGRRNAAVHCVIVGFGLNDAPAKRLFVYDSPTDVPQEIAAARLNPYLIDAPILLLPSRRQPLNTSLQMAFGSMPNDRGHLLLTNEQRNEVLTKEPELIAYIRPIVGADEFINKETRWCFWLPDVEPKLIRQSEILHRIGENIRAARASSTRDATQRLADTPLLFGENRQPTERYLLVPGVSSENRRYVPMDFMEPDTIASNLVFTVPNATLYHFGVLTSAMHMAWMRYTCGRLKSDYRYSKDIVYNNFPWPTAPAPEVREAIEAAAQAVLNARAAHPGSTLADLYDPLAMPPDLRAAHHRLDKLIDHLYQRKAFRHDTERVQRLFEKYDELHSPLAPAPAAPAPRPRRPRAA
jgi:hypothetical protein